MFDSVKKCLNILKNSTVRKSYLYLLFACICVNLSFAQKGLEWMSFWERSVLDSTMNLHYTHNKDYVTGSSDFNLNQFHPISFQNHTISSSDGHVVAVLKVIPPITQADTEHSGDKNKQHLLLARSWVNYFFYREDNDNYWKNLVTYLSEPKIKSKTNADTIIVVSLSPKHDDHYIDSYPYCKILILQKENRGCLPMLFLYDEVGKKDTIVTFGKQKKVI